MLESTFQTQCFTIVHQKSINEDDNEHEELVDGFRVGGRGDAGQKADDKGRKGKAMDRGRARERGRWDIKLGRRE